MAVIRYVSRRVYQNLILTSLLTCSTFLELISINELMKFILGRPFLRWDEREASQSWREFARAHGIDPCAIPQVRANPRKEVPQEESLSQATTR